MGTRRGSRRRRRRPTPTTTSTTAADAPVEPDLPAEQTHAGRYGKAALALAFLLGLLVEQIARDVIPADALDLFHLAVLVGIAFFVARWYRGYMRRALNRRRAGRRG